MFDDLFGRIRAHADRDPSRTALTFAPAHLEPERVGLTYGEVVEQAEALARVLSRRAGRGERVLLLFPAAPEFTVSFLACLAAGVIAVPVPVPIDEAALRRVVNVARDCSISAVLSISFIHDLAAAGSPEMRRLTEDYRWILVDDPAHREAAGDGLPGRGPARPDSDDIAFLQYTSGSTSTPRGVTVTHGNLVSNEAAIASAFGVRPDSRIVSWLPLHHDMGLIGGMLQPLWTGASGVILEPLAFVRRPAAWLEEISRQRADISGGPNFAYELCVRKVTDEELAGLDLSSWRVAFNGAAQVFPRTLRSFDRRFAAAGFRPDAHLPCYGLAESTLLVAGDSAAPVTTTAFTTESLDLGRPEVAEAAAVAEVAAPDADADADADVAGDADGTRELTAYRLLPHAEVSVVDPASGAPLGPGRTGEIVVAGASNAPAYWGDPDRSASTFRLALPGSDEPHLRTGDLGFLHDGALYVQGRCKDLVIHRGRNLYPEDLEADAALSHPALRPGCCAIFGIPREPDEDLVVCQEVRTGTPEQEYAAIADRIRVALSGVHGVTAERVLLVPAGSVPKTSSGKIQRQETKRRWLAGELTVLHEDTDAAADGGAERAGAAPVRSLADRLAERGAAPGSVPTAELLTEVLCDQLADLLRLDARPSGEESLIALGLDSMRAVQLQYAVEEALGTRLRTTLLLRAASVRELAAAAVDQATSQAASQAVSPVVSSEPEPDPARGGEQECRLTAAQRSLWFLQRAEPGSSDYNVTRAFRLTGDVDPEAVQAALGTLVRRHPSLRLSVALSAGEPRGTVLPDREADFHRVDARGWSPEQQQEWYRGFATTPFDLGRDPLTRCALLRREADWLLVLSLHHLVCDLASFEILVDELPEAYTLARAGSGAGADAVSDLPGAPGLAVDAPAERELAALSERGEELAAFWRQQLDGELPVLALSDAPDDGSGTPPAGSGAAHSVRLQVSPETTARLADLARDSGLTSHNLLLSVFQLLLHRFSGQDDLIVGVPASTRDRRTARWVGYLVNVVPVRSRYASGTAFDAFAKLTQQRVLDAMEHQELPLPEIVRLVNPDRRGASATLYQAMFSYYAAPATGEGSGAGAVVLGDPQQSVPFGPGALHGHPVPDLTAQAELCLNAVVRRGALHVELQYDPAFLTDRTAAQLGESLLVLLDSVADGPTAPVGGQALLSAARGRERVDAGRGPVVPRAADYLDEFEGQVDATPDAVAADDGTTRLTYAELDARANETATRLRALGVGTDAVVLVCARRSVDFLVLLLGIHKADGCYVPISPLESPRRVAEAVGGLEVAVAVADGRSRALLAEALRASATGPRPLDLAELTAGRSTARPRRQALGQAAGYLMYSSGSTGAPKAIVATNAGIHNHLRQMVEYLGLGPKDCVAQTAPVTVDLTVWQLLAPLLVGGRTLIVPEPASLTAEGLLAAIGEGGATVLELVPSLVTALLDAGLADRPGRLRAMLATGDPLTPELPYRWGRELPSVPLHNAYGSTEVTDDVSIALSALGDLVPPLSVGKPLANSTLLVLDRELNPVPDGVTGSLHVGGVGVTRGYLGDPRRTALMFVPDPYSARPGARLYRMGDLAAYTAAGEAAFRGRSDGQVKIRGLRVDTLAVEAALRGCEEARDAAVTVADGRTGAVLVGHVVLREHDGEHDGGHAEFPGDWEDRIRAELDARLPRHMVPSVLVRLPRLPRTGTGKIDYRALKQHDTPMPTATATRAPRTAPDADARTGGSDDAVAAAVAEVWADVLGTGQVGWTDSFFQLGGHSLLAVAMVDRVSAALGVELDLGTVFSHPRLCDFVAAARDAGPATDRSQPGHFGAAAGGFASPDLPVPASAAQQRFWFLREMDPDNSTYNMPGVLRLHGELDPDALEAALRDVLTRNRVLLARFSLADGELWWTAGRADEFRLEHLDLRGAVAEFGDAVFDRLVADEAGRPADLSREFPFRASLARLGNHDWRFFVTIDHLVCDGVSLGVFTEQLAAAYNRRVRGLAPEPVEPGYTFADYCHQERESVRGRDRDATSAEWDALARRPLALSPLSLSAALSPSARSSVPGLAGAEAGRLSRSVDEVLADAVRRTARRTGTTPYLVFATALAALTRSGGDEPETVLFGTLIAQRDRPEWREVVGPLLNVSLLGVELAPDATVDDGLAAAREAAMRAHRNARVPFQEIASRFPAAPGGDGSPFEVMLVMQPEAAEPDRFENLTTVLEEVATGAAPYPLTVDIEEQQDGYRVNYRYALDRYHPAEVEELSLRLDRMLRAVVAEPGGPLGALRAQGTTVSAERS